MAMFKILRTQAFAAAVLTAVATPALGIGGGWERPREELVNRPDRPFACLPLEAVCHPGL